MAQETITLKLIAQDLASGNISKAIGSIDKLAQRGGIAGSIFQGVGMQFGMMLNPVALAGRAFGMVTDFMGDAVSAASVLQESQSKVNEVFTVSSDVINQWASESAKSFGLSEAAALEAAGTFGNFIQALGNTEEQASDMSRTLVELAADLASFNNQDINEVILALRSGLTGEAEPMRRLGVSISATRVEANILAKGIARTKGEITDAMKVAERYAIIMQDTAKAQGDFDRTAGGAANQARTLAAETTNLQAAIGEHLLPIQEQWNDVLITTLGLLNDVLDAAAGGEEGTVGNMVERERKATEEYKKLTESLGIDQEELGRRIWASGYAMRSYADAMEAVNEIGEENLTLSADQLLELKKFDNQLVAVQGTMSRMATENAFAKMGEGVTTVMGRRMVHATRLWREQIAASEAEAEKLAEALATPLESFRDITDAAKEAGQAIRKALGQDADKTLKQLRAEERRLNQQRIKAMHEENWRALDLIDARQTEVDAAIKAQQSTKRGYLELFETQRRQERQIDRIAERFDVSGKRVRRILEAEGGDIDAVKEKLKELGNTEATPSIKVMAAGALQTIDNVKDALAGLFGSTWTPTINAPASLTNGTGGQGGNKKKRWAAGGVIRPGDFGTVGETGPESVRNIGGSVYVTPSGRGGGVTININGGTYLGTPEDARRWAAWVVPAIERERRRAGVA